MTRYAVFTANDELMALRPTMDEAKTAIVHGLEYLDGAATCGHPSGPGWVRERLPLHVRILTDEQVAEVLLDDEPMLDREP